MAPFAMQFVPQSAQREVPWRNGGGSTREVAIDPPGASVASGFRWRISIAGVAADGPFSSFPGIDRSLWLLRGGGLQLRMDGREVTLARRYERIDFAGEMAVQARLLAGATEDLNVMVARDTCQSSSDVLAVPRGSFDRDLGTGQHVVLALDGALEVAGVALAPGDAVRLGGSGRCAVTTAGAATFLLASFW